MLAAWQSSSSMVVVEESRGVLRHSSGSSMLVGAAAREGHAGALLHHSGQMHRLLGCTLLCCLLFNQDHITSHFASHHTDAVQHFVPYAAHYLGIPCCTFFKSSCIFLHILLMELQVVLFCTSSCTSSLINGWLSIYIKAFIIWPVNQDIYRIYTKMCRHHVEQHVAQMQICLQKNQGSGINGKIKVAARKLHRVIFLGPLSF